MPRLRRTLLLYTNKRSQNHIITTLQLIIIQYLTCLSTMEGDPTNMAYVATPRAFLVKSDLQAEQNLLFHYVCFLQREDLVELSPYDQHFLRVVNID